MATESEGLYRHRCQTRGPGGCSSWRTDYLMSSNCHLTENRRQATTQSEMQVLNKHAVRERLTTHSLFYQATLMHSGTKKSITDVWNVYHSVPIREDHHNTRWGWYRHKTPPEGYAASQDRITRR